MQVRVLAVAFAVAVVVVSVALATTSNYRTGTLEAATTYVSVQRSDWNGNVVHNQASVNIFASHWAYNTATSTYIYQQTGIGYAPGDMKGQNISHQQAKLYCRRTSGGAPTAGRCFGDY